MIYERIFQKSFQNGIIKKASHIEINEIRSSNSLFAAVVVTTTTSENIFIFSVQAVIFPITSDIAVIVYTHEVIFIPIALTINSLGAIPVVWTGL